MRIEKNLYKRLRTQQHLKKAWQVIRANASAKGASRTTRSLAQAFANDEDRRLRKIQDTLRTGTFDFPPARGVAIKKEGKATKRPLVVFDIETRIVQRGVLDIIKKLPPIKATLESGYNFGGIEGADFGVPAAVKAAVGAAKTYSYFIRSDIKAFFDNVTRDIAVQQLTKHIDDEDLVALISKATSVELANRAELGADIKYFPSDDHGLAQGSCLSPLLCNLVLEDFDVRMNSHGVRCIRYVDDFVIFAADRRRARAALMVGLESLKALNLTAYDPQVQRDKAEEGTTTGTLHFLGCEITHDRVKPTIVNRRKLLAKIDDIAARRDQGLNELLGDISRTILGWGNTFGFCNDDEAFSNLDRELHKRIKDCVHSFLGRSKNLEAVQWLTAMGIQPLAHRKRPNSEQKSRLSELDCVKRDAHNISV